MALSSNWKQLLAKQSEEKKLVARAIPAPVVTNHTNNGKASNKGTSVRPAARRHKRVDRTPAPPKAAAPKEHTVLAVLDDASGGPIPSCVAMDCEMVGVGPAGATSALARCSIVDFAGAVLYDKYVRPLEKVVDYRTAVSGIEPAHVHGPAAVDFKVCQAEVATILNNRVLVGHALHHDMAVLLLSHPRHLIRDTSRHKELCPRKPRSLKALVSERLGIAIQSGRHDSVEDARSVMAIYKGLRKSWEKDLLMKNSKRLSVITSKKKKADKKEAASEAAITHERQEARAAAATKRKRAETSSSASSPQTIPSSSSSSVVSSSSSSSSTEARPLTVTFSRPNKRPRTNSSVAAISTTAAPPASSATRPSLRPKSTKGKSTTR